MKNDIYKTNFTIKLNEIDNMIRNNNKIDYKEKSYILQQLQLLHNDYKLLYEYYKQYWSK